MKMAEHPTVELLPERGTTVAAADHRSGLRQAIMAANGPLGSSFLVTWHVIGFSLFLGAGLSMFFSVPSPLRIYHTQPDAAIVFRFPMVLAPNFTVPLFMIAHLLAQVKLLG